MMEILILIRFRSLEKLPSWSVHAGKYLLESNCFVSMTTKRPGLQSWKRIFFKIPHISNMLHRSVVERVLQERAGGRVTGLISELMTPLACKGTTVPSLFGVRHWKTNTDLLSYVCTTVAIDSIRNEVSRCRE